MFVARAPAAIAQEAPGDACATMVRPPPGLTDSGGEMIAVCRGAAAAGIGGGGTAVASGAGGEPAAGVDEATGGAAAAAGPLGGVGDGAVAGVAERAACVALS